MRTVIVAFVSGAALAAVSAQGAPLPSRPSAIGLRAAPPIELEAQGCGGTGIATTGEIGGAVGTGAGVFGTGD